VKIVLTCGHPYSGFELAHAALVTAGLEQAKPSRRELLAATELQSKILASCEVGSILSETVTQLSPGKMWQALALDLMMANLEADCWGWGDASTARLLDFWADIDGQVRYVLVYSSPEFALGQMLRNRVVCPESVDKALAEWSAFNTELLRFYNRHRERCFLVDSKALLHETARFVNDVTAGLGLGIGQLPAGYYPDVSGVSTVACGLAKGLVEDHRGSSALYRELESSADLTSAALSEPRSAEISAWIEYLASLSNFEQANKALRKAAETSQLERGEFEQLLNEAKKETNERNTQLASANASLNERAAELSALKASHSSLMAEIANRVSSLESRNAELIQLQRKNAELMQEIELLATQLRQAQEEVSKRAAELAEVMTALSRQDSEVASLQAGSKGLMLENESLVTVLSIKSADIAQLESKNAALIQGSELLAAQARQVQEETSKRAAELAEVRAALSRRDSEVASLQAGSKGLMLENESLVTALSMKSADIAQLASKNAAQMQEIELLAAQVRQAQEEAGMCAAELAEVRAALSSRDSEVASLQAGCRGLMLENESLVSSLTMKSADIAQLESKNAALIQGSDLLAAQARQAQDEASEREAELAEVRAALSSRDSDVASLQVGSKGLMLENESLVTALSMKSAEIAQLHSRNEILVQENELFALQVSQAHEELEQVCRSGVARGSGGQQQGAQTGVSASAPVISKPDGVMIDFRGEIEGENWYYAEHDGRWAGPGEESTLFFSSPRQGSYELLLDVVDAMEPEILRDMTVFLNGKSLALGGRGQERCGLFSVRFATNEIEDRRLWELRLKFPKLVSPAIHGHDDRRVLAIRVKSLQLRALY
jgi:hypothetical protein